VLGVSTLPVSVFLSYIYFIFADGVVFVIFHYISIFLSVRAIMVVIVWLMVRYLLLPIQLVPITIYMGEFEFRSDEVYSMQYYVIKFVSDLLQVSSFLQVLQLPPPVKLTATL
jgi:hypothetical protein